MQISLAKLLDDAKCVDHLREVRWPEGRKCPHCERSHMVRQGVDDTQPARHRYRCTACLNGKGEYARDEDGDGFHEVHVNTIEGGWSLLRPWLRPHRGISQRHLPLYVGCFEFIHNIRKRGKALFSSLVAVLLR